MKLSIIIPVYNVEQYVEKCIRSCENQDVDTEKYEIIIVNDGSPDGSLAIVERLASEYNNIKVISQANGGLSVARNTGLISAIGEYVWFVDSDDWISENCLGRIFAQISRGVDIIQIQYRNVYDDDKLSYDEPFTIIDGIKSGREVTLMGGLPAPAQFSIFRRKFLLDKQLKFVPGILHEDVEFKPRATYLAESIVTDEYVCYHYYQRPNGSITSKFALRNAEGLMYAINSLYDFARNLEKKERHAINYKISSNINSLLFGYRKLNEEEKRIVREEFERNKKIFICMIYSRNPKFIMEGIIFSINISLGLYLHKFLR